MTTQNSTTLERDLEASRLALRVIAPLLYTARGLYLGELGRMTEWPTAPAEVKRELIRVAEQAVRSVMAKHRHDAERHARLVYVSSIQGALRGVLDASVAYDPDHEHFIRRILASSEQALVSYTRDDVARAVIEAYLSALVIPAPIGDAI